MTVLPALLRAPQAFGPVEPVPSRRSLQRFVGFSVESGLHEYADPLDRSPSLWDDARVVLPTVGHTRPFLEFNLAAGSADLFSNPHSISRSRLRTLAIET